jgi:hypothetical protein
LVVLTRASPPWVVFHEAGHALQSEAHFPPPNVADVVTYRAFKSGRIDDASERCLRYLANQPEFEISLQDLNRFYAISIQHQPITSPEDSVVALMCLGMPLTYDEVRIAFAGTGQKMELENYRRLFRTPAGLLGGYAFEDARRLLELRRLAVQADPTLWPPLLRKIIFESPGHL